VTMCEAYAQRPVGDDLGESEVGCFDVEIALDDLQIRRNAAQKLVCLSVCDVAKAKDLSDLARRQELLELEVV
jgi:hypothetical protein